MNSAYRIASGLIITGFFMLCQPFARFLYEWGFPVLLAGVIMFMVLDHLPSTRQLEEDDHG